MIKLCLPHRNWMNSTAKPKPFRKPSFLNTLESLRSAGKYDESLEWCRRTESRFNQEVTGTTALFNESKIYLLKGDYATALDAYTRLRSRNLFQRAPGSTNRAEVDFMRAY